MADLDISALIRLGVDDTEARAVIQRLKAEGAAAAAANPTPSGRPSNLAQQKAEIQGYATELQRAANLQKQVYVAGARAGQGTMAGATSAGRKDNLRITKEVEALIATAPKTVQKELRQTVGTTDARQKTLKDLDAARQKAAGAEQMRTLGPAVVAARGENLERGKNAKAESERLRQGRQSEKFVEDLVELDVETRLFHATMELARGATQEYTEAAALAATAHQISAKVISEQLAADENYIAATLEATRARQVLRDTTTLQGAGRSAKGLSPEQVADQAAEVRRRQGITTTSRRVEAIAPEEIGERAAGKVANLRLTNNVNAAAEAEGALTAEILRSRVFQQGITDKMAIQLAGMNAERVQELGGTRVAGGVAREQLAREQAAAVIQGQTAQDIESKGQLKVAQAAHANEVTQAANAEGLLAAEILKSKAFQQEISNLLAIQMAGLSTQEVQQLGGTRMAAIHAREQIAMEKRIVGISSRTEQDLANMAKLQILEGEQQVAIKTQVQSTLKGRALAGELGGTRTQRVEAALKGNLPQQNQGLGAIIGTRGLSSFGHMVGGFASGALIFGMLEAVKEASKLQEQLASLEGQMNSLGQGAQFTQVRDQIKSIANETGTSAIQVTKFAARLLGIFDDPARAIAEADAAMKLAVVSGTDMNTMLEEMVPVMRAFNVGAEEMGDLAVYIHDRFGIAEEQTLHFFGETASSAEEAGLSLTELGIIGASAANSIGKSMTVTGEQFTKVLGQMTANQDKIFAIFRRSPATAGLADQIADAFGAGKGGDAFKLLIASYDKLDRIQQDSLIRTLGSRREWALLNGLFQHSGELLNDLSAAEGAQSTAAGGLERRFQDMSATIQRVTDRVKELFKNMIEGIVSSGLGAGLGLILASFEQILKVANIAITVFGTLNDAMKFGPFDQGLLVFIASMVAMLFVAQKAWQGFNAVKALGNRATTALAGAEQMLAKSALEVSAAEAVETESVAANTVSKEANLVVSQNMLGETIMVQGAAPLQRGGAMVGAKEAGGVAAGQVLTSNIAGKTVVEGAEAAERQVASKALSTLAADAGGAAVGTGGVAALARGWGSFTAALSGIGSKLAGLATAQIGSGFIGAAGPIAAMAVSGLVSTNIARDKMLEGGTLLGSEKGLSQQSSEAADAVKNARKERLEKLAEEGGGVYDRLVNNFQEAFFDVDLPKTIYQKELNRREGARGRKFSADLKKTGQVDEFAKGISDANAKQLEDFLKQDDAKGFVEQFGLLDESGKLNRKKLEESLPAIEQAAEAGDKAANLFLSGLNDIKEKQATFAEMRKKIDEANRSPMESEAVKAAGGMESFLQSQYDPKGALAIGKITPLQVLAELDTKIAEKRRSLAGAQDPAKAYQELNALIKEREDFVYNLAKQRADRLIRAAEESGAPDDRAQALKILLETLPRIDPAHQYEMLDQVHKATIDAFDEELAHIQDPIELYRRQTEGAQVSLEEQSLDMQSQVGLIKEASDVINKIAMHSDPGEGGPARVRKEIADAAVRDGVTFEEAARKMYEDKIALYESMGLDPVFEKSILAMINAGMFRGIDAQTVIKKDQDDATKQLIDNNLRNAEGRITLSRSQQGNQGQRAQAALQLQSAQAKLNAALERQKAGIGGPTIQAEIDEAQAGVNDALRASAKVTQDVELAMLNWAVIEANGDPVKENAARLRVATRQAQLALQNAGGDVNDPDVIRAQQEIRSVQLEGQNLQVDILRSQFSITAALASRDPLETARIAMEQAQFEAEHAKGQADENEKLAAKIRAEQSYADALSAVFESRANLAQAIADANGDTVGALTIARDEAQRKLDEAVAQGVKGDALNPYLQRVVEANDALGKGSRSRQQQIIDFQLAMGQITTESAIASLQLILSQTKEGTDEYMALAQKIHQMEQSAGADLQFNLPTQLGLPTLYESRRLSQSAQAGIGYQDNRTVTVAINVNGAQDPAATAQQVMAALTSATGSANIYSGSYTGVG